MNLHFPTSYSHVYRTPRGVSYLTAPGAAVVAITQTSTKAMKGFLDGFDIDLRFADYLNDPTEIDDPTKLVKATGQLCYMSFGPGHTPNAEAARYIGNIKSSGHGSVMEHANITILLYGIDRAVTHELVRHRAGMAYSQVSQRYVSGKTLRFVERPEWAGDIDLHERFVLRIEAADKEYEFLAESLIAKQNAGGLFQGDSKTDRRKRVQQAARSCLPNETEAPIFVTGNVRAWRHFLEMRCSPHADVTIREAAYVVYTLLCKVAPELFSDYTVVEVGDGTKALETATRKV